MGPARRGLRRAGSGGRRRRGGAVSFALAERTRSPPRGFPALRAPWGARVSSAASSRRSSGAGASLAAAARHPGRCPALSVQPRCPWQLIPPGPPRAPSGAHSPAIAAGGGGGRRRRRDRGAGWSGHLAPRPAPARTPSPASYFRTRKVRAAPGDSAAAPVPGSRVRSRVARRAPKRRTVQTRPWLLPPPAPGSPTSISSSRSWESKLPCLASPRCNPTSPPVGTGSPRAEAG